jgi:5-formyltetrahydrofolate cyclo-ligase
MTSAEDSGTDVGSKRARRRELLEVRRALPPAAVAAASQRVVANLRGLVELSSAAGVGARASARPTSERALLLYAADADEIDLSDLLDAPPPGFRVLLPRVEGDELVTVLHEPGDVLVTGELGVREPTGPAIDPADVDVVVVPGVAFSPSGGRLGRGRGMYDRLLPRLPHALRIGVCIEQLVVEDLPLEAHDARMGLVVTDASIRRRDASGTDAPA